MLRCTYLLLLLLATSGSNWLFGQAFPFSIRILQPDQITSVANGSGLSLNSTIGTSTSVEIELTYRGSGVINLTRAVELAGSNAFTIESSDPAPGVVLNSEVFRFRIRFQPRVSTTVSSQITIPYRETIAGTGPNPTTVTNLGFVQLGLFGTAPEFFVNYILQTDSNFIPVANGGRITFPTTLANGTSVVQLSIVNRGSGAGTVNSIAVSGDSFVVTNTPLLPTTLSANTEFRINLQFRPKEAGNLTGSLTLKLGEQTFTATLDGTSVNTLLSYELAQGDNIVSLTPGALTNLGEVNLAESLTAQVTIRNAGVFDTVVSGISISGQGFSLSELPLLPRTLRPGQNLSFFVSFAINLPGPYRGRLRIGDDVFEFTVSARGSRLNYSYVVGSSSPVTVTPGGGIFFPPTQTGQTSRLTLSVRNSGTTDSTVISIFLSDANAPFSLSGLPALPLRIAPNESISLQIEFKPTAPGNPTLTLRLDNDTFTLAGSASGAATGGQTAFPGYRFSNNSGTVQPLDQPLISLSLNAPFNTALSGVLTIVQENISFAADPSVRFSNGAQSISFTIAANTREAVFPSGSREIRLQTGSVAGDIFLSASFAAAGVAVSDPLPAVLRLSVLQAVPRILGLQVGGSAGSVSVLVSGLVTNRSLRSLDLDLKPVAGINLINPKLSINLDAASSLWFGGASSLGFGGIFQMQVPLSFSTDAAAGTTLPSSFIESLSATLRNQLGASNVVQYSLTSATTP